MNFLPVIHSHAVKLSGKPVIEQTERVQPCGSVKAALRARLLKALDSHVLKTFSVETPHPFWAPVPVLSHSPGAAIPPCI